MFLLILAAVAEAVLWQRLVFDDAMFRMSNKLVPLGRLTFIPSSSSFAGFRTAAAGSTAMRIDNANANTVGALQLNLPADVRQSAQFFISCLVEPVVAQPRTARVGMYVANVEEVQPNGDIWGQDLGAIIVTNGGWFASSQSESTGDLSTSSSRPARPNEPTLVVLSVRKVSTSLSHVRVRAFSSGENFDSFDNTSVAINTVAGQGAFTMHNHLVLVGAPIDFLECRVGSSLQDVIPTPPPTTPAPTPSPTPAPTPLVMTMAPASTSTTTRAPTTGAPIPTTIGGVSSTGTTGASTATPPPSTTAATAVEAPTTAASTTQQATMGPNSTAPAASPTGGTPTSAAVASVDQSALIGAAVGGAFGGGLLVALVVGIVCWRRSSQKDKSHEMVTARNDDAPDSSNIYTSFAAATAGGGDPHKTGAYVDLPLSKPAETSHYQTRFEA